MSNDNKEVKDACENCFYVHKRNEPHSSGNPTMTKVGYYCRRYPPSTIGIIRVSHDGWCGEYHKQAKDNN